MINKDRKPPLEVVAGILMQDEKFLLCCRPLHKARGGQWEFPGGKIEAGESMEEALARELFEELGIHVTVGSVAAQTVYAYPELSIHLTLLSVQCAQGSPHCLEHMALDWFTFAQAQKLNLCPADRILLDLLRRRVQ